MADVMTQTASPAAQPQAKMSVDDFANAIKQKYPAYQNIDNNQLTQKILEKYPVYSDRVNLGDTKTAGQNTPATPTPDQASAQATGATFPANTQTAGRSALSLTGEVAKTVGNIPSSAFGFVKGAVDLVNPVSAAKKIGQIPGAFSGLSSDLNAQRASEQGASDQMNKLIAQYQQFKTAGKDTTHIENFLRQNGLDPTRLTTQTPPAVTPRNDTFGSFAKELPGAAVTSIVPEAGRATGRIIQGAFTGNQNQIDENLQRAQRAITNDPVGQILPFLALAEGGAKALDKTGVTTDAAGALERGVTKVAEPVTKAGSYAFGKAADVAGKVAETGKTAAEYSASQLTGLDRSTLKNAAENPNLDYSKINRADVGAEIQDALQKRTQELGITPESLGQEVQSALAKRASALEDTGGAYKEIRDLKAPNTEVSRETQKVINQGGNKYVYDLKEAPNEKLTLPELRQKANLMEQAGSHSKAEVGAVRDLIEQRAPKEALDHTVKVNPNYLESSIRKTTGLDFKDGEFRTSGKASIREAKDVRALQNLYDTWKPSFTKGKLTTTEFLNFRADLAQIAKFDREITKSAPLENLSKIMRRKFNDVHRGQVPGLAKLDETFSTQKAELKELTHGIVDKNGQLTDTGLAKIAKATEEKPNLIKQLEQIAPGITDKIQAFHDLQELGKGIVDKSGEITDAGLTKIARATEDRPQMLERLEKIKPGITEKIKQLQAAEDIRAAAEKFKVGTYGKQLGQGGFVAGLVTMNPYIIAGSLLEMVITNPKNAIKMVQNYSRLAEKSAPYRQALVLAGKQIGSGVNNLPEKVPSAFGTNLRELPAKIGAFSRRATVPTQ